MNKLIKKWDIISAVVIIVVCLLILYIGKAKTENPTAKIYVDSKCVYTIVLNDVKKNYQLEPIKNVLVEVKKGKIRFINSDCKDKLCVKSGWLSKNNDTAACLPKKVVISVSSGSSDFDVMTY